ncbi:hypothetical protein CR970_00205 [Candidatus Saccharibacteria bacterium]|nr:MAG: hypothetical protein CR970_00205 [Candidatus Saccharibacteria bacterium]
MNNLRHPFDPPHPKRQVPDPQPEAVARGAVKGDTRYVHVYRKLDPEMPKMSERTLQRHKDSLRRFPGLNLSPGEYVISAVTRHPIGIIRIWTSVTVFVLLIFLLAWQMADIIVAASQSSSSQAGAIAYATAVLLSGLAVVGGIAATYIYNDNYFYLTNESVIQETRISLFSRHEQTVSLSNIEDASFRQEGILPTMLNYGAIRLSTEGDETTYRFNFVANPKKQVAVLNNAVEAFKNGRPVYDPSDD